VLNILIRTQV